MSFANRLEKITANAAVVAPTRNDWTLIEVYARAGFGFKMEELRQVRFEPVVLTPHGQRIVFVDFCPGGVMCNRQDVDWINQGICAYETFATEDQKQLFDSIRIGDVLVMKKDLAPASVMLLQAHGRMTGFDHTEEGDRILQVDWSHEHGQIETPAMGVGKLVTMPDVAEIQSTMPLEFWRWLRK